MRRKEVEVGGEGGERASLERLRAVDYYVTMETNLHFTSPDSFFFSSSTSYCYGWQRVSAGIR